ncbi:MAG: response regulator [Burkholderiales bacterium]|nr:response regulator [Burkholderiales bacterium]
MTNELMGAKLANILLAEDNEDDVVLMRHGFELAKLAVGLHHVENGHECMNFLRKTGKYADAPTPDIVLLDLNMPIMSGREVLAELVADEKLNHIPVVILTTSAEDQDILSMYKLRCSSYIVKPVDFDQFLRVIRGIGDYWLTIVVLPRRP